MVLLLNQQNTIIHAITNPNLINRFANYPSRKKHVRPATGRTGTHSPGLPPARCLTARRCRNSMIARKRRARGTSTPAGYRHRSSSKKARGEAYCKSIRWIGERQTGRALKHPLGNQKELSAHAPPEGFQQFPLDDGHFRQGRSRDMVYGRG